VAPGKTPNDYQLLRLHVSGNNRQFQSVSGGLEHETSGAVHDFVDYSSRQVGADAYQVVLDSGVGAGEYGFLAPQDTPSSGGAPSSGKIYTFAIVN